MGSGLKDNWEMFDVLSWGMCLFVVEFERLLWKLDGVGLLLLLLIVDDVVELVLCFLLCIVIEDGIVGIVFGEFCGGVFVEFVGSLDWVDCI